MIHAWQQIARLKRGLMSKKKAIQKIRTQYLKGSKRTTNTSEVIVVLEGLEKEALKNDLKEYATFFRGCILSRKKDYKAAIVALKKAIELDNDFAFPWNVLGNVYFKQKDFKAAIVAYKKAIKLDNKLEFPWTGLGIVYAEQKDYKAAIVAYKKAIELDNKFAHPYRNLGLELEDISKHEEAEKYFQKALSLFKHDGDDYWTSITKSNLNVIRKKLESKKEYEKKKKEKNLDTSWIILQNTKKIKDKALENQKNFLEFLTETDNKKNKENGENYFQVLRRWNSYTPIIADNYHISKGGGYFINIAGKGIVVDPGFNFIDNFKGSGHLFSDIDAVITSHAHNDHTSDIESILALLYKYNEAVKGIGSTEEKTIRSEIAKEKGCDINKVSPEMVEDEFKKSKRRKEIDLYITLSVFKKFTGLFELLSNTDYKIHSIEKGSCLKISDKVTVEIIGAKHFDIISDRDSTGMVLSYNDVAIIYTGDTGWSKEIEEQYKKIAKDYKSKYKLLVAHLGGFKEYEQFYKTGDNDYSCFYKNHLGRLGLAKINEIIKTDICFISEFGEELKGHRMEIADIFNKAFKDEKTFFLPADIGLTFNIDKRRIKAITKIDVEKNSVEYGFVEPKKVKCCLLRKDYSLHYYFSDANLIESDLMQVLIDQYDRSTK